MIVTRAQAKKKREADQALFEQEFQRLAAMDNQELSDDEQGEQQQAVHPPQLVPMDGKLVNTLLTNTLDKLPKFGGTNNEDVNKWLFDITNELNLLKLVDRQKLFTIQTFLVDDARQWYINNLSTINDWSTFVEQIQKTFSSTMHQKLALKNVGSRLQSLDETVLHYYNDMMTLFRTIGLSMNDQLKVAYLRAGLQVSLQKEVSRKNPQTPMEFLQVAQEEEKLDASINIPINNFSTSNMESLSAIKSSDKLYSPQQQDQQRQPWQSSKQIRCYRCNKIGHIARNCFSKNY